MIFHHNSIHTFWFFDSIILSNEKERERKREKINFAIAYVSVLYLFFLSVLDCWEHIILLLLHWILTFPSNSDSRMESKTYYSDGLLPLQRINTYMLEVQAHGKLNPKIQPHFNEVDCSFTPFESILFALVVEAKLIVTMVSEKLSR